MTSLSLFAQAEDVPQAFSVAGVAVRQDVHGRFCLNDLHKAAGNENRHRPSLWADNQQAKDLIAEINLEAGIPALDSVHGGSHQGTYACKELVYAYAMWVSAAFHLQVIRAYDETMQAKRKPPAHAMAATALTNDIAALDMLACVLNVADSGKLGMMRVAVAHHAPHLLPALPSYAIDAPKQGVIVAGSSEPTFSATHLLKAHGVKMSAVALNKLLCKHGLLSHENRRASNGRVKAFWTITDKGLAFGKNVTSDKNPRETQPHWYESTFARLLEVVGAAW